MNMKKQISNLEKLISGYLIDEVSLKQLVDFSWGVIDYFSDSAREDLPPKAKREKEFWYAVWLIQHVADEEHEKDGTTERLLKEALGYLREEKKIPDSYNGDRP